MKVVPLSEAKAKLSRYGRICHREPVVITVNGRPSFQLVPLNDNDDLVDRLIADHPGFRALLAARLAEPTVPAATMLSRFEDKSSAGSKAKRRPKVSR